MTRLIVRNIAAPPDAKGRVVLDHIRPPEFRRADYMSLSRSLPFVESTIGHYTHRVRAIQLITQSWRETPSMVATCWCGQSVFIGKMRRGFGSILAEPSEGRPVCATCEGRAIGAGQAGAREIAGRAVMFSPRKRA